ncbi:armadillo-type protein [Fimicolochytrium jonesii]|uniref:armadillo-type protein n=1 Tax=Fimicolochytrium jonesii TaxID=1396493 RepID=UPI0022FDB235|nr:armadillo-type protein [Fimicolochytrium jonesii]KAI8816533.1 armadillo-type protein [Fimicolochytrium jonesii]
MADPFSFEAGGDTPVRRGVQRLSFSQRIVPLAVGKGITTAELVNRLKKLHNDLRIMEQEAVDTKSLQTVQKDLRSQSLLAHKDKGVRVLTACCLADILRLFAPDAPYNQNQLREIFEFFLKQMQGLSDKTSAYYQMCFYLLDSLSTVKSVVLVADLNADDLVVDYFRSFFDLLRHDLTKSVTMAMVDILQQLIDESHHIPQEVVELILSFFRKPDDRPSAYKMATDLCNSCPEKLQRYVCQYFSEAIMAAGHGLEDDEEREQWEEAHTLILQINRASPAVLLNVIPLLEEELKVEYTNVRTLATKVLGEMFSVPGSKLAEKYPQVWKSWVGRRNDKHAAVRLAWVEWTLPILRNHVDLAAELNAGLKEKCIDPDEKVRTAVLNLLANLDVLSAHNISAELLVTAGSRMKDKRAHVRDVTVDALAKVFNLKYSEIVDSTAGEAAAVTKYAWISGEILDLLYLEDPGFKVIVEKALFEQICPPTVDDALRSDRLLNVAVFWTNRQLKAFVNVLDRQAKMMQATAAYLDQCEKYNGGIMDDDTEHQQTETFLGHCITYLASRFPEPKKAASHLQKFAKANDGRLYKLLRGMMDLQSDYKQLVKNVKEVTKRLDQLGGAIMETFAILLRRISLTVVTKSTIPHLVEKIQQSRRNPNDKQAQNLGRVAETLLKYISTVFPALYRSNIEQFTQLLQDSDDDALVADSLDALARFTRVFPEEAPNDSTSRAKLVRFALEGTPQQAKNAVVVLAHIRQSEAEDDCRSVLETIMENLNFENEKLTTHMTALAQFARHSPGLFEAHYPAVSTFIVKDVLLVNRRKAAEDDVDWVELEDLETEGVIKILGLKVLTKRLIALAAGANGETSMTTTAFTPEIAVPILKLIRRLLISEGEIVATRDTSLPFQAHLRLTAGIALLKLAKQPSYATTTSSVIDVKDTHRLALVMQDPIYQVRHAFVDKLMLYLSTQAVQFEYMTVLMLAAHEPEVELRNRVKTFLTRKAKMLRATDETNGGDSGNASLVEHTLVKFLHLLAHHPDFGTEVDDLMMFAVYVEFFLECVANADNASFLYYVASKLKTVRDLWSESSDNLYILSDLTQLLIQEKATHANWSLPSYPGRVHLPKELFGKLTSAHGNENARRSYLPKALVDLRAKKENAASGGHSTRPKREVVKREKEHVNRSREGSDNESGGEGDEDVSDQEKAGSKRKARKGSKGSTGTPAKRRRSGGEEREGSLPVETPQRKNAPRSARAARNLREVSSDEEEEGGMVDVKTPVRAGRGVKGKARGEVSGEGEGEDEGEKENDGSGGEREASSGKVRKSLICGWVMLGYSRE